MYRIWKSTRGLRAQLVFSDLATPGDRFNIYDELKRKLTGYGIPPEQIEYIHNAKTDLQKAALFAKVRSGEVRVLIGSTPKMGAGTNVQKRLIGLHHIDVPWRPSDIEQREGRILRRGNDNKEVEIFRYVTRGTFDAYSWQVLEHKQRFISQIMTGETVVRSAEDIDAATLSYAEIKALATGNPLIKEKMEVDLELMRLNSLKQSYAQQRFRLDDSIHGVYPAQISALQSRIANLEKDIQARDAHGEAACPFTIRDVACEKREDAAAEIAKVMDECLKPGETYKIGRYMCFELRWKTADNLLGTPKISLSHSGRYFADAGVSASGNLTRIENIVKGFDEQLTGARVQLEQTEKNFADAKAERAKPFAHEEKYIKLQMRQTELNTLLDTSGKKDSAVFEEVENDSPEPYSPSPSMRPEPIMP